MGAAKSRPTPQMTTCRESSATADSLLQMGEDPYVSKVPFKYGKQADRDPYDDLPMKHEERPLVEDHQLVFASRHAEPSRLALSPKVIQMDLTAELHAEEVDEWRLCAAQAAQLRE